MACTTLPADIQGCLNIELRRGDGKPIQLDFWDDAEHTIPKDMSIFTEIRMSIRQGGMTFPAVVDKSIGNGLDLTGNRLTIHFGNSDPVFQRAYSVLSYDIAFIGDRISHGIGGHIIVKKSETDTWTL